MLLVAIGRADCRVAAATRQSARPVASTGGGEYKKRPPRSDSVCFQVKGVESLMQLAQLWRQHKEAGCPSELVGVEIAGTDARALDAEISSCVCALLSHTLQVDERIERRLVE